MFRDSDAEGLIGMRAYLYYFQDMSTGHLYHMGKGNDSLPENYGAAWIYTKYKMRVFRRVDYSRPLHLETWIEKQDKMRIWQDLKFSAGQEVCALGRLESFVFHLKEIELHFLAQSFYHDEIRMYRKADGNSWLAAGVKPDGTAVLSGRMTF